MTNLKKLAEEYENLPESDKKEIKEELTKCMKKNYDWGCRYCPELNTIDCKLYKPIKK